MLIMLITYRVLSTLLSVPDMGIYYFLLSISSAFGLIYANPIGMYANRMMHGWLDHGTLVRNIKIILYAFLFGSILTIPVLFFFHEKIQLDQYSFFAVGAILVFYVFSTSINGTLVPGLNLLGHTREFVVWTLATNVLGLLISCLLVRYVSPHPLNWLLGQGIALFFCGWIAYFILLKNNKNNIESQVDPFPLRGKRVAKFALPIVVTNLAVWVLCQSFRFFFKDKVDLTLIGELTFGLGLATSLCVALEYLFQQLYLPHFYRQINISSNDNGVIWNKLLNRLISPYIYITIFIVGLAPFIMRVLADVKFKNSGIFLALGAVVELLRMLGNVFNSATQSEMKTHKAIVPYIAGGVITLIGVFVICARPEWAPYTPYCLMAGQLTALILLAINVKSMIHVTVDFGLVLRSILFSLVFLTALFFKSYSENMLKSILVNVFYGLFLLFLLYRSYLQGEKE